MDGDFGLVSSPPEGVGPPRALDAIPEETILWTPSLPCSPEE